MLQPKKRARPPKPPFKPLRLDQRVVSRVSVRDQKLIGRVMIASSKIENAMEDLIWCLLDIHMDDGRILTKRLDARSKSTMLRALASRHLPQAEITRLSNVLDTMEQRQEERNFIAHGSWGTLKPENVAIASSLKPNAAPGELIAETFPKARFDGITNDLADAMKELVGIIDTLAPSRKRWHK